MKVSLCIIALAAVFARQACADQVLIKSWDDKYFILDVNPTDSIANFKHQAISKVIIPEGTPELIFQGVPLENNDKTLAHYGIENGSMVRLVLRNRGGFMHLLIRFWDGRTLKIDTTKMETIDSLKRRICDERKIPAGTLDLTFQGKSLDDKKSVGDYSIENLSTMHLVVHLPSVPLQVQINEANGKTFTLKVSSDETVASLKQKIAQKQGIPEDRQRLIFNGMELYDTRVLGDYNMQQNSIITLETRVDN